MGQEGILPGTVLEKQIVAPEVFGGAYCLSRGTDRAVRGAIHCGDYDPVGGGEDGLSIAVEGGEALLRPLTGVPLGVCDEKVVGIPLAGKLPGVGGSLGDPAVEDGPAALEREPVGHRRMECLRGRKGPVIPVGGRDNAVELTEEDGPPLKEGHRVFSRQTSWTPGMPLKAQGTMETSR